MYINQHSVISFSSLSDFHLITVLVHLLAIIHAERIYVYAYKVSQVAVSIVGVSLSVLSQAIVQELTTSLST